MVSSRKPAATTQGNLADSQRLVNSHVSEPGNDTPAHPRSMEMTAATTIDGLTQPFTITPRQKPPRNPSLCSSHIETGAQ